MQVTGETNTDDLSPAPDAWSRPDIPVHGLAMLKIAREGIVPDEPGKVGPIKQMEELQSKGHPLAYVGDVVGTGSSRKSATNSVLTTVPSLHHTSALHHHCAITAPSLQPLLQPPLALSLSHPFPLIHPML